jgi:hypothetical protein
MRDFFFGPIWIIALVLMFGVLAVTALIVTRRLSSVFSHNLPAKDAPPLSDMLTDSTTFAPRCKDVDDGEQKVRVRPISVRATNVTVTVTKDSEKPQT